MTAPTRAHLGLAFAAFLLQGCATTEALYAEYDKDACKPRVVTVVDTRPTTGDPSDARGLSWEPAVYFAYDQTTLEPTESRRIDRVAATLKAHPNLKLSVQAFTDPQGSAGYNIKLSGQRAAAVIEALAARGIEPERMIAAPLGEALPVMVGEREDMHAINRRVELLLLDAGGRPLPFDLRLEGENQKTLPHPDS